MLKFRLNQWFILILICVSILPAFTVSVSDAPAGLPNVAEAIIIAEGHFIDVPFYYQVKTYYCGPAALQMVFDYFGENVSQFEIADVARTVPYVTYTDELRRAVHFSDMSTSMGSEMPENITGYSARKLGYAAFEMFSMTLDDLKALIDRDFPVILLMRWIPGESYGHYRVAVGYNATHVFLHDPWNNVLWGGDYGGPNLPMNYTFFNEMWDYSGHWGLFVSPWNVKIETPSNIYVGQTFTVTATVFYVCPLQTPIYVYEASSCNATITLPEGLAPADGESPTKTLGEIYAGGSAQTSWRVKAERPGNYSITVEAEGKITGIVGEKAGVGPSYQYEDRIGGYSSSFVNAEVASHIYIDAIKPIKGTPGTEAFIFGGGATPNGTVVALLSGPINQTIVIIDSQSTKIQENVTIIINMTLGWTVADSDGFWSIPFTVPEASPGEYEIFVLDNFTQTSDVTKFYVLPPTPTKIRIENISPVEGYPDTLVFIAGHGATPKGEVKIYFDHLNAANTIAYDDGGWSTTFIVPDVSPGNYTILALDVASNTSDNVMFIVLEFAQRSVGVKEGDWAKYNVIFNYSTNDPTMPVPPLADIDYLLIRIVSVVRTNVTYESIVRYKNGTEQKEVSWLDITTGLTCYGATMSYGPIIAANLTAGDKVYFNDYAPTINLTSVAFYAGLQRVVNSLLIKTDTTIPGYYRTVMDFEIHWDRISGILCEQKMNASYTNIEKGYETSMFLQMVITETSIWIKPSIINVKVSFCPRTLNLKSRGKWIICIVKLPKGYTVKDVDKSTIMLNGTIKGEVINKAERSRYLIVRFDRKAVIELISKEIICKKKSMEVSLTITGEFKDGTTFSGTATIRIIIPSNKNAKEHTACLYFKKPHLPRDSVNSD
ncbi:MAG: C39 family peptidase [Candidatus Bathyarchaeia archaeon]